MNAAGHVALGERVDLGFGHEIQVAGDRVLQGGSGRGKFHRLLAIATGEERTKLWQEAFRRIYEDLVADVMLYHMVGYTRVGPRVKFTPSISTNSELQLAQIKFAE